MCGIVGFAGKPQVCGRERFIALCRQSCIRGVHAFGIAWWSPSKGVQVFRSLDFEEVMSMVSEPLPCAIIFHNRYSTSGDYRIMANNQPVFVNGTALVFNGTVDMGTKEEMEQRYGITLQSDNDGEIVLNDVLDGHPFRHISKSDKSFAGITIDNLGRVTAFRNKMRPLWLFAEQTSTFICSTKDIASRAGLDVKNGKPVEPLKLTRI